MTNIEKSVHDKVYDIARHVRNKEVAAYEADDECDVLKMFMAQAVLLLADIDVNTDDSM